jgi:hypothetical protein
MKYIVVFGNCQAEQLTNLLAVMLPTDQYRFTYLSNNPRTGNMKSNEEILREVQICDLLIYQPLSKFHGTISEEYILSQMKPGSEAISFSYIFNSGVYSLCLAPRRKDHGYGKIYGEDIIINEIKAGKDIPTIIKDYQQENIDFDLVNRFNESMEIMQQREETIDIKLSEYIIKNFRQEKLFITHNHPSNILLFEIIKQINRRYPLNLQESDFKKIIFPDLRDTNSPISPYDVRMHQYQFPPHQDWLQRGTELIKLIVEHYHYELEHPGKKKPYRSDWIKKIKTRMGNVINRSF